MKIAISVMGRFHAFNLAQGFNRSGCLDRLITTYPRRVTRRYGLPNRVVASLWPLEVMSRLWMRVPTPLNNGVNVPVWLTEAFDCLASRRIHEGTDIFVGWSSVSLRSLKKAHGLGALTIVDEGSSHVLFQMRILQEEYERHGLKPKLSHPCVIEKELEEYTVSDYIAVPSSFVKQTFLDRGISEQKLICIPYGVDPAEFKPVPKEDSLFRVIHCGTLSLRKGVHYLLQAFSELNLPNSELWLVGAMTDEIMPFLKKYDNAHIFHKGPYPQKKLFRYYSQGSIFCLASIEDGFGMVILQAMACGLPVIATLNTGGADVIEDGVHGYIVPTRNAEALKEKILFFYKNEDQRRTMGEAARNKVTTSFTWRDYSAKALESYGRILEKKRTLG